VSTRTGTSVLDASFAGGVSEHGSRARRTCCSGCFDIWAPMDSSYVTIPAHVAATCPFRRTRRCPTHWCWIPRATMWSRDAPSQGGQGRTQAARRGSFDSLGDRHAPIMDEGARQGFLPAHWRPLNAGGELRRPPQTRGEPPSLPIVGRRRESRPEQSSRPAGRSESSRAEGRGLADVCPALQAGHRRTVRAPNGGRGRSVAGVRGRWDRTGIGRDYRTVAMRLEAADAVGRYGAATCATASRPPR
jgi:hypothetical protein